MDKTRHWQSKGYVLLAVPHDVTSYSPLLPPATCRLLVSEIDADRALFKAWENAGDQFFYWIREIEYSFSA